MSEPESHRSRTAWPGPMSVAGVGPGHEHELPAPLVQRVRFLTRVVVVFGVCLLAIGTALMLILADRGKARDEKDAETQREIRESWCLALDTFPAGIPSLERLRAQYDCGPGIPFEKLTPDEQNRLQNRLPPQSTEPAAVPDPAPAAPVPFASGAPSRPAPQTDTFRSPN